MVSRLDARREGRLRPRYPGFEAAGWGARLAAGRRRRFHPTETMYYADRPVSEIAPTQAGR